METNDLVFQSYYVHGCKGKTGIETCPDHEAEFWTIYGKDQNNHDTAIGDFKSREAAETIMNAIINQNLSENSTNPGWKSAEIICAHTSLQMQKSKRDPYNELIFQFVEQGIILADAAKISCWHGNSNDPIENLVLQLLVKMAISIYHNKFEE